METKNLWYNRDVKGYTKSCYALLGLAFLSGITIYDASALTYSNDVNVSFTFNTSIQVSLSAADLIIPNLNPGTADDSNIITVNVTTNNITGYQLGASVGNNSTYNHRDLKQDDSNITNKFTSITYTTSPTISSNTNLGNNKWGFSYLDRSLNNGTNTTWANYNGLPLYSSATWAILKDADGPASSAGGDNIEFKIAAKATNDQPSGTYKNVINFKAVVNPAPPSINDVEFMQEFATLSSTDLEYVKSSMIVGQQYTLYDERDYNSSTQEYKPYYVAKFSNDDIWMTQNLDYDLSASVTLTPDDTDIPDDWTPDATYLRLSCNGSDWYDYPFPMICNYGDYYWDGMTFDDQSSWTSSGDRHYHMGNFYNAAATFAMDRWATPQGDVIDQSICPAGWTLPTFDNEDPEAPRTFNNLLVLVGVEGSVADYYFSFGDKLYSSPLYMPPTGAISRSTVPGRDYSIYWSNFPDFNTQIDYYGYDTSTDDNEVIPYAGYGFAYYKGLPIRCVAR